MNWLSIDGRHEGAIVAVLEGSRHSLPLGNQPAIMLQKPSGLVMVEDHEVTGWRVSCSCYWLGELWTRTLVPGRTDLDRRLVSIRPSWPADPPRAAFDLMKADWKAHAAREVVLTELTAARKAEQDAATRLANAAAAARAAGLSWTAIGEATGMKKQSAQQRWTRLKH